MCEYRLHADTQHVLLGIGATPVVTERIAEVPACNSAPERGEKVYQIQNSKYKIQNTKYQIPNPTPHLNCSFSLIPTPRHKGLKPCFGTKIKLWLFFVLRLFQRPVFVSKPGFRPLVQSIHSPPWLIRDLLKEIIMTSLPNISQISYA